MQKVYASMVMFCLLNSQLYSEQELKKNLMPARQAMSLLHAYRNNGFSLTQDGLIRYDNIMDWSHYISTPAEVNNLLKKIKSYQDLCDTIDFAQTNKREKKLFALNVGRYHIFCSNVDLQGKRPEHAITKIKGKRKRLDEAVMSECAADIVSAAGKSLRVKAAVSAVGRAKNMFVKKKYPLASISSD